MKKPVHTWVMEVFVLLVGIVLLCALAYGLWRGVVYMHHNATLYSKAQAKFKADKIQKCKHVGFYGRYGERKVYDCNGILIREGDL